MENANDTPLVAAKALSKSYGTFQALKPSTFTIPAGRIVGVIGANGAGKSTLLNTLLGLSNYDGELTVLGRNPYHDRATLMQDVCFIADVATLPKWMTVQQVLDTVAGLHPKFSLAKSVARLAKTNIKLKSKVQTLSKGMVVQVHLSIVLAIDAKLLVLDEPTLGLDIVNRRNFYDAILTEYFDETRSILITTHQVDEIEQLLSHAMFIRNGEIIVDTSTEEIGERYRAVDVLDSQRADADSLGPIYKRSVMGRSTYVFDSIAPSKLERFGDSRRVGLADLFVALMGQPDSTAA
jgi:ABC-2 type transport system ATP-binding protein